MNISDTPSSASSLTALFHQRRQNSFREGAVFVPILWMRRQRLGEVTGPVSLGRKWQSRDLHAVWSLALKPVLLTPEFKSHLY